MKAFKKLTVSTVVLSGLAVFASGLYNSMVMGDVSFMTIASAVKFTKRLDEINGKVVVGRLAASTGWQSLPARKITPVVQKQEVAQVKRAKVESVNKLEAAPAVEVAIPEPAITADLEMTVSNVFYKKPLEQGQFSGSARAVDGVVEEVYVNLPDGKTIEINTRDRLAGNVFTYEDTNTREDKSGLFYEVKPGTYMITLANDSQFAGARIELTTENGAQIAAAEDHYNNNVSWDVDKQNTNGDYAQEEYRAENDNYENEQQYQDQEYQDNAAIDATTAVNFQS